MNTGRWCPLLALIALVTASGSAQQDGDPVNVFGYLQGNFTHIALRGGKSYNSFGLQQMNLFLTRDLGDRYTVFSNLEFTNDYSSKDNWGTFKVEEAWGKYRLSNALSVKVGLLIPPFNNLNEIKNKTPLLPYIVRPLAYESSLSEIFKMSDYVPQRAFVEVYGSVPTGAGDIEYAVYGGNAEESFISSGSGSGFPSGMDTSSFKLIGGRVGFRNNDLRCGVSAAVDKDNMRSPPMGVIQRLRLGTDLSVQFSSFSVEAEAIYVDHFPNEQQRYAIHLISMLSTGVKDRFDRLFYYGLLQYDFTDELFAYGAYMSVRSFSGAAVDGVRAYSGGGGYRITRSIVAKVQGVRYRTDSVNYTIMNMDILQAAVSLSF